MQIASLSRYNPNLQIKKQIQDRPAWIPANLIAGWERDPYAYQTEEEMMPAGGAHGQMLIYLGFLANVLKKRGLMLLADIFMLYRRADGIQDRVAPDYVLIPYRDEPPSAVDLEEEHPSCVIEITSPSTRKNDLNEKVTLYLNSMQISTYLVIDMVTARGKLLSHLQLHLWQRVLGQVVKIKEDDQGYLYLPPLEMKVRPKGTKLQFLDATTGKEFLDSEESQKFIMQQAGQLLYLTAINKKEFEARLVAESKALKEEEARIKAEQKAQQEAEARLKEEEARLKAEQKAQQAEAEIARLRALLAISQGASE